MNPTEIDPFIYQETPRGLRGFPPRLPMTPIFPAFALAGMIFLAYLPAFRAGWIWDDDAITENVLLQSGHGLWQIWTEPWLNLHEAHYWPLVYSGFWIERRIWGAHPAGYHAANIVLHALNSLLIWRTLARLGVNGAWTISALFALHPIHVESVAWVIERKDVQSAFFFMLATLAYLRFDEARRRGCYALALVLFVAAMFSKSAVAGFPVAMGLIVWERRGGDNKRFTTLIPFALVAIGLAAVDAGYSRTHEELDGIRLCLSDRFSIAGRAIWFYVFKILWPAGLTPIYPKWDLPELRGTRMLYSMACAVSLGGFAWMTGSKGRKCGRGIFSFLSFFLVGIAPTLGLVQFGYMKFAYVADRFAYLGSVGLIAMAGWGLRKLMVGVGSRGRNGTRFGKCAPAAILAMLGALTWNQSANYADAKTLWRQNLTRNPRSWVAHYNLGTILAGENQTDTAVGHLEMAVELQPEFADAHNNLGLLLRRQGKIAEAIEQFEIALQLNPQLSEAQFNRDETLRIKEELDKTRIRGHGRVKENESPRN